MTWEDSRNKMKNKKYHTARTIPKSNIKIAERGKIDAHNTQIHDRSLFHLCRGISMKTHGGVKIVVCAHTAMTI